MIISMPPRWTSDEELFTMVRRELYTAVIGDIMDKCKLRRQFFPPEIHAMAPNMFMVGRALTVLAADVFEEDPKQPFGLMLEALDSVPSRSAVSASPPVI